MASDERALEDDSRPLLIVTGLNHRTAEIELRESFALANESRSSVLEHVLSHEEVDEAVVLSTCNRVELVVSARPGASSETISGHLEGVLSGISGIRRTTVSDHLYHFLEKSAVAHVFRVASGLDSLILGEPQVLGQLKSAYEHASRAGAAKGVLHRLFHRAFSVAKAVRTQTGVSQSAVSVCYAARELALRIFGDLSDASVMLIGAGETGALALKHFSASGVKRFIVLNKTISRASELAELCAGVAGGLDNISEYLAKADIVIGAAAIDPKDPPLVTAIMAQQSLAARGNKPQLYLDLAVPRNVAAAIDNLEDAFLYNVDDLEGVVRENMNGRRAEAERAETIVSAEADRFWRWFETLPVDASIRELALRCDDIRSEEIEKTLRRLQRSAVNGFGHGTPPSGELRAALEDMAQAILAKTLHGPLTAIKSRAAAGDSEFIVFFRELFLAKRDPAASEE